MQNDIDRFKGLTEKLQKLDEKKIRLEEQYKTKKEALSDLIKKIKAAGYDPLKLKDTIAEKESDLKKQISDFEKEVEQVSAAMSKIEV